jgi:cysteinyl-tRNA synthetase
MKVFNTLTHKKETFKVMKEGELSFYSCGPTVYDFAHIGNFRFYIFNDILRRYFQYQGFEVTQVMNITDVDDKTIKRSIEKGQTRKELTEFYTREFVKDLETLNIETPEYMPKATDHINEMLAMIRRLLEFNHAYVKDHSVYFRISSYPDYGKLAGLDPDKLKENAGGRLDGADEYDKEDARDFVLWKARTPEDGSVYWATEFGEGRPGWHIECSCMSIKYLGQPFDLHTGGEDLIFPHHTNEIAQAECAFEDPVKFANYWLHAAHLKINGEKMSKSEGNFYTLRDLLDKGYDPKAIRYSLLSAHYRQPQNFTEDGIKQAAAAVQKFHDFLDKLEDYEGEENNPEVYEVMEKTKEAFEKCMDDDLNISGALGTIFEFMKEVNKLLANKNLSTENAEDIYDLMEEFDSVLGVMEHEEPELEPELMSLIEEREKAREEKNFEMSDKIRDLLKEKGIIIEDSDSGTKWKRA